MPPTHEGRTVVWVGVITEGAGLPIGGGMEALWHITRKLKLFPRITISSSKHTGSSKLPSISTIPLNSTYPNHLPPYPRIPQWHPLHHPLHPFIHNFINSITKYLPGVPSISQSPLKPPPFVAGLSTTATASTTPLCQSCTSGLVMIFVPFGSARLARCRASILRFDGRGVGC